MPQVARRFALLTLRTLIVLAVASVVIFLLLRAVPGNPAEVALGVSATPEEIAALTQRLGLDEPLIVQYFSWVTGMLTGDFGISLSNGEALGPLIASRAIPTAVLCLASMALSLVIALPLGILAARGGRWSRFIAVASQAGIAIPSFLAGVLLVSVFAVRLGWFPANGWVSPTESVPRFLLSLVLPVVSLAAVQGAILTRYIRSAVLDVVHADFMRTARSLGLSPWQALRRHGLRNATLPVLTVTGVQLTTLIVGAVVIERVFVIPGLGSLLLDSVATRDLTAVQAVVMLLVVATLLITLAVEVLSMLVDPRIRRQEVRA